jgi:tRNA-uridine 2-sulfurtransferase
VCFIAKSGGGRESFLGDRIPLRTGTVVDTDGGIVGTVPGVELVTIGQRRGIAAGGNGERRYVVDVDTAEARVVIGELEHLLVSSQPTAGFTWTHGAPDGEVLVQVSAHGAVHAASVEGAAVRWHVPQRRVAPGQAIVVYDGTDTRVLGGAVAA